MGRILIEGVPYHVDNAALYVGRAIGLSEWLCIDQARIDAFGRSTDDLNPLHMDPAWCRANSPFGKPIAHGFLTLSLLSHLGNSAALLPDGVDYGINSGFERVRFMAPVPVDSHVRLRATLLQFDDKGGGRWLFKARVAVEVRETDKIALAAVWIVLVIRGKPDLGAAFEP
jgi:acyl dehydratase